MKPAQLQKVWPKIEAQLQIGDILLFHKRKGPISRAIQRETSSYWNHSGLVFLRKQDLQYTGPLIVEALNLGIEIHQIKKYTDFFEVFDIGVKRFSGLTGSDQEKLVTTFILENLDVPYDFSRIFSILLTKEFRNYLLRSKFFFSFTKRLIHVDSYICSSFVHEAYLQFSKADRNRIEFDQTELEKIEKREMYSPSDLARDDAFEWVFNPQK
ncbi:MAG: YiiX/YebB-like N1pC/P60 family cysteine hydrolase [bacterium]|nr:YiiX/YebB-like N1pC/P60 family cysteine hydrolase [bacterium]